MLRMIWLDLRWFSFELVHVSDDSCTIFMAKIVKVYITTHGVILLRMR